jgi:hypothetical protein
MAERGNNPGRGRGDAGRGHGRPAPGPNSVVYFNRNDATGEQIGPTFVFRFDDHTQVQRWNGQQLRIKRRAEEIGPGNPDNLHEWEAWLGEVRAMATKWGIGRIPFDILEAAQRTMNELRNLGIEFEWIA